MEPVNIWYFSIDKLLEFVGDYFSVNKLISAIVEAEINVFLFKKKERRILHLIINYVKLSSHWLRPTLTPDYRRSRNKFRGGGEI